MPSVSKSRCPARRKRGMTFTEVLVAALILAIVAGGAAATWTMASRAAVNKRAIEMGFTIAVHEIERMKAIGYQNLTPSPIQGGQPVATVRWYDKYGQWLGSSATSGDYKVKTYVRVLIDRNATTDREDLKEILVEVWDPQETRLFERARTLLTFGGV